MRNYCAKLLCAALMAVAIAGALVAGPLLVLHYALAIVVHEAKIDPRLGVTSVRIETVPVHHFSVVLAPRPGPLAYATR